MIKDAIKTRVGFMAIAHGGSSIGHTAGTQQIRNSGAASSGQTANGLSYRFIVQRCYEIRTRSGRGLDFRGIEAYCCRDSASGRVRLNLSVTSEGASTADFPH
jgi:hypothetical protein